MGNYAAPLCDGASTVFSFLAQEGHKWPGLFIALYIPLYERLTVGSIAAAHKAFAMFVTPLALAMLSA